MSGTSTITVVPNRYLTPKFPYIFGLSSKQTLNIPSNQGVGAPPASGGESEGGSSTPQTPSLVITNQPTNATIADGGTQTFSLIAVIEPELVLSLTSGKYLPMVDLLGQPYRTE
ncbi:MAG: hypothetical protein CM15mV13_3070 [uncultured marine virus]|nr:MAG: hypothetical protein CM15mV13_3070 [uncultured marine virus]